MPRSDLENSSSHGWLDSNFPLLKALHWIVYLGDELVWVLNIFLLVPFAILLSVINQSWSNSKIFLSCAATSIIIELTQWVIPGRVSDIRDVALNTTGPTIWLVFQTIQKMNENKRAT